MRTERPLLPLPGKAVLIAAALALGACATRSTAPVEERRTLPPRTQAPLPGVPAGPPTVGAAPPATAVESDWRPQTYTVRRGDTLHAIALEHGLDYRELAAWNAVDNPNVIRVGQVLRLAAPGERVAASSPDAPVGVVVAPLKTVPPVVEGRPATTAPSPTVASAPRNTDAFKVAPKAVKEPYSEKLAQDMAKAPADSQLARAEPTRTPAPTIPAPSVAAPALAPPAATPAPVPTPSSSTPTTPAENDDGEELDWTWPAKGKLVTGFSDTANLKGIDIAGAAGQAVVASAPGRVVYAGSGLRGYGKLVIIKHNKTFLSAYAHNRDILVKEGQQVSRGQKIAEMGSTDADQVKLHFEIRRLGRPMDPLKYLPPG
jgi:lipoprotein NlpD